MRKRKKEKRMTSSLTREMDTTKKDERNEMEKEDKTALGSMSFPSTNNK